MQNVFQNTAVCSLMQITGLSLCMFVFFPAPLKRQNPLAYFCPLQKSSQLLALRVYLQSEIQFLLKFLLTPIQPWFHPVTSPQYLHKQAWKTTLGWYCSSLDVSSQNCFSPKHSWKEGTIRWCLLRHIWIALDTASLKIPIALT